MTLNVTNLPSIANRSYTITAIINTTTNKVRFSAVQLNGSSVSNLFYVNGASQIPALTSASRVIQSFTFVYKPNTTTLDAVYSSVNPFYA